MAAQGFWFSLVVGLTIAAIGLVTLLRVVAKKHLSIAPAI
jgi:hypothetical protein